MIYRVVLDDTIDLHTSDINCMLLNPSLDLEMNSAGSFNFTLPPSHPYWDAIKVLKSTIDVYEDGDLIFTGRIASIEKNWNNERVVQCEGALAYFNDSVHRQMKWDTPLPIASADPTVHNFLKDILDNHNVFEGAENANRHIFIGNITVDPEVVTREVNYDTTLDILTRMCIDTNGGYMSVRKDLNDGKLYLDWIKDFTEESGQPAQFGLNLLNFDTSLAAEDICTGVLARGAEVNEQTVMLNDVELVDETTYPDMSVTHYTTKYQDILWHREGVAKFGQVVQVHDFSDAQTAWKDGQGQIVANSLFEMAKKWLEEKNTKIETIEVEVAELAWLGEGMPKYKLGQIVELSDNVHMADESYETRLLPMYKLSCDLNSGSKKVTLGTPPKKELTQISASNSDSSTLSSSGSSSGGGGGSGEGEECRVHDVRVDGTSVVTNKIANISLAGKADVSTVNALATTVAGKADTSTVNALATVVASKQNQIEFNTLEAATEVLTRLKADNVVYNLGGGTEVEANPSEAATDDLETIKIGNTVYDIPGGGSANYGKFKCDVLFDTPTTTSAWASPIEICSEEKAKEYDMVYLLTKFVDGTSNGFISNSYLVNSIGQTSDNDWMMGIRSNSRWNNPEGFIFLSFDDSKLKFYTNTGNSSTLYKVYGLKFENKLINRSDIYSEEERMIGRWTDGKPLYQKTWNDLGLTIPQTYWQQINISMGDMDYWQVISNKNDGTGYDNQYSMLYRKINNLLQVFCPYEIPLDSLTIQYTKTTDSADSGVIPEDPMFISDPMIYSEEEQVVGSWTDGKPLYQKVVRGNFNGAYNTTVTTYYDDISSDIEDIHRLEAYAMYQYGSDTASRTWFKNNFTRNNNINFLCSTTVEGRYISLVIMNPDWAKMYDYYMIIQYTKTTDSILSGPKKGKIVQRSDIYSEEERLIGRWTDGKPLYQKTWFNVANNTDLISNVDTIVDYDVKRHGNASSDTNYYDIGDGFQMTDSALVRVINGVATYTSWSGTTGYINKTADFITLKYTKTTDAPFSKQLIEDPQFVMMSDIYSEDEQVVGRWTDGKPLYQKTIKINSSEITIGTWNLYSAYGTNSGNIIKFISGHLYRVINNNEYVDWFNNWTQHNDNTCMVSQRPSGIEFKVNNDMSNGLQYVAFTIQYTKTTDSPGTGPTKGNLIYLPVLYSEEEREVGVWTDGKPLYQKTIIYNTPFNIANGSWYTSTETYLNMNLVNAVIVNSSFATYTGSVVVIENNHLVIGNQTHNQPMNNIKYITIQYTKTTDQPGSGRYLPDGQLAHHYSTSEHIVGTWIDGSTVYERTWDFSSNPISLPYDTWVNTTIQSSDGVSRIISAECLNSNFLVMDGNEIIVGAANYPVGICAKINHGRSLGYLTLQYTKSS